MPILRVQVIEDYMHNSALNCVPGPINNNQQLDLVAHCFGELPN